jgi:hypothetical protein
MQAIREGQVLRDELGLLPRLMGGDWYRLHPSVRARFAHEPAQPVL